MDIANLSVDPNWPDTIWFCSEDEGSEDEDDHEEEEEEEVQISTLRDSATFRHWEKYRTKLMPFFSRARL